MIRNVIFDFGRVFIGLNVKQTKRRFAMHGIFGMPKDLESVFHDFERGRVSSHDFVKAIKSKAWWGSDAKIKKIWEELIGDFPKEKLELLEEVSKEYRCFLLSNINEIHEHHIRKKLGEDFFNRFWNSFEVPYYSHHIGMRKPDLAIFNYVLNNNDLDPEETLFIDDTHENIIAAESLGIKTWHLTPDQNLMDLKNKIQRFKS